MGGRKSNFTSDQLDLILCEGLPSGKSCQSNSKRSVLGVKLRGFVSSFGTWSISLPIGNQSVTYGIVGKVVRKLVGCCLPGMKRRKMKN